MTEIFLKLILTKNNVFHVITKHKDIDNLKLKKKYASKMSEKNYAFV